jgi:SWI/SNF-related matrix-associated actin-dependent regulator of chromatin subfamily A3
VASVQDLAKLPVHPAPPSPEEGSLNVRLLHHQLQGLAWMIQAEHPTLPPVSKGKASATSNEPHTQFWTKRQDDNVGNMR